jgi:hypothetical protein
VRDGTVWYHRRPNALVALVRAERPAAHAALVTRSCLSKPRSTFARRVFRGEDPGAARPQRAISSAPGASRRLFSSAQHNSCWSWTRPP